MHVVSSRISIPSICDYDNSKILATSTCTNVCNSVTMGGTPAFSLSGDFMTTPQGGSPQ